MKNLAHEHLLTTTESFKLLGHAPPLYEFILEHGVEYNEVRKAKNLGEPKNCFANAANRITSFVGADDHTYVEG